MTVAMVTAVNKSISLSLSLSGPLRPEITIAYVAVSLIFFNSGLSLKTEVRNWRSRQTLVRRDRWYAQRWRRRIDVSDKSLTSSFCRSWPVRCSTFASTCLFSLSRWSSSHWPSGCCSKCWHWPPSTSGCSEGKISVCVCVCDCIILN